MFSFFKHRPDVPPEGLCGVCVCVRVGGDFREEKSDSMKNECQTEWMRSNTKR